jgi:hypothetical protein
MIPHYCENCHVTLTDSYLMSIYKGLAKLFCSDTLCGAILVKAECMRVHVSNIETAYFCNQEHYEKWHLTYYGYPIG